MDIKTNKQGSALNYFGKLTATLDRMNLSSIDYAIEAIAEAWQKQQQIIVFGNGGSAITALHYVTDWNKMIPEKTGKPFRGRTLVDNMGLLTAFANDICYSDIFLEQLKNLLQPQDVIIAISGSGNSENVIRAVQYANENQAKTIGLCGFDGGRLKNSAQLIVHANINDMQISEDIHAMFGHVVVQSLCGLLDKSKTSRSQVNREIKEVAI